MSDIDKELNLYLDERLSPEEARSVEERLERDPEYRRRFEALARVPEAFSQVFEPAEEPDFDALWSGIEARLDEEASPEAASAPVEERAPWWHWLLQPVVGLAVVTAIGLITVWMVGHSYGPGPMPGPGARTAVAVSDGQTVSPKDGEAERIAPVVPRGERRQLVQEQRAPRVLAIVESYDVSRGVVVVNAPSGSPKQPLVIWHIVPGEGGVPAGVDERSKL
jgi:anti-sigma factor RsiW